MEIKKIEYPIASRKLTTDKGTVLVTIGKPSLFEDQEDYYCAYSIELNSDRKTSYAVGVDSVQALQLALKKIAVDLEFISRKNSLQISWFEDMPGETGFDS